MIIFHPEQLHPEQLYRGRQCHPHGSGRQAVRHPVLGTMAHSDAPALHRRSRPSALTRRASRTMVSSMSVRFWT